jgi:capsular polysaccharide biosynthesis protein
VREDILAERHQAGATRALFLKDVVLFDRAFYAGMHKEDLFRGRGFRRTLFSEPAADLDQAVLSTSYAGARWFGHFLHDDLPLELLASGMGRMVGHARPPYPHEPGWRKALDTPGPEMYGAVRARELIVLDDIGQNPEKRRRYATLRGRLTTRRNGPDRIVIRRPASAGETRAIREEDALWERLQNEGFRIIDPSTLHVDELLQQCAGASLVVSVDGSHAVPALYLARPDAVFLVIYPPSRVSVQLPQMATFYGLRAAMFIGEPIEGTTSVFNVDPDELLRLIQQVRSEVVPAS